MTLSSSFRGKTSAREFSIGSNAFLSCLGESLSDFRVSVAEKCAYGIHRFFLHQMVILNSYTREALKPRGVWTRSRFSTAIASLSPFDKNPYRDYRKTIV